MKLYRVILRYAVFGLEVNDVGIIINAAPIAKGFIGKHINSAKRFYINVRKGKVEEV